MIITIVFQQDNDTVMNEADANVLAKETKQTNAGERESVNTITPVQVSCYDIAPECISSLSFYHFCN